MVKKKKILIISGQTATGKTNLGIFLAKNFNGEVVSFDSRQAYQKLDIITGKEKNKLKIKNPACCRQARQKLKITIKNLELIYNKINDVPIWLYDVYDPKEQINAFDFCQKADLVIDNIVKRGKLPIIVGGTVFYIKSFLQGFQEDVPPNWELRKNLDSRSLDELQTILKSLNYERFARMNRSDQNNKRRLIRAIEIHQMKLKIKNQKLKIKKDKNKYKYLFLSLVLDKEVLKEKIKTRVEERIRQGALEEIKSLLDSGYSFQDPGLNTLGYKQLKDFFLNKISFDKAKENWIKAEIDYARRQLVFLKKIPKAVFLNPEEKNFLEKTKKLVYKWLYASKN